MVVNTIRSQGAQMAQKVHRSCRCRAAKQGRVSVELTIPIPESIPEPIPIPVSIPESILDLITEPIPGPILESISEPDSGPNIRNRFQKTAELTGIDSDKSFIFPITSIHDVIGFYGAAGPVDYK
ncbi:AGAP008192-PA [Anopheles gambiae str. PEST]|uniref:AGAP008192-PA n=1 Tax=Anopheles gambiae TaxID=7165 RepID=Q5TQF8_ANOGA|nr:AGAP008192-PA [Anopheles gambiae str. PEST]